MKKYTVTVIIIFIVVLVAAVYIFKTVHYRTSSPISPQEFHQLERLLNAYIASGKYEQAAILGKKSINSQRYKSKFGEDYQLHMMTGFAFYTIKQFDEAEKVYQKLIPSIFMMSNSQLSCYYLYRGRLLQSQGRMEKAVDILLQAAKINDKTYLGSIYTTLGVVYLDMHKDEDALAVLNRRLNFTIKEYGANSEETAESYFWLGRAYLLMKKLSQAKKFFNESIAMLHNHQSELAILAYLNLADIANIYDKDKAQALGFLHKAQDANNRLAQPIDEHQQPIKAEMSPMRLGQILLNLGLCSMNLNNDKEAEKYFLKSLTPFNNINGNNLFWQGTAYLYLAHSAQYHKKWKEAEKYYEQTAELLEKYLGFYQNDGSGELHDQIESAFTTLCLSYKWLQRCFCVNQTQSKALVIYEKIKRLKTDYPNSTLVADIYPGLVSNFMDLEKYEDSLKLANEAIDLYSSMKLSPEEQDQVATLWWLKANIFHLTGKLEKAIQAGKKAYTEFAKNHSENSRYLKKISSCLKDWEASSKTKK